MKIYTLFQVYHFEGRELIGVYSSEEQATEAKDSLLQKRWLKDADFEIEEYILDEMPN